MCGILGIVNTSNSKASNFQEKVLKKLFVESESRGKEASGFCFVNDSEINIGRIAEPASRLVKSHLFEKAFRDISLKDSSFSLFFGHARLVTHGYEYKTDNNQPLCLDNLIVVHNGIVINHKELWSNYLQDEKPKTDLDTEIIPLLYQKFLESLGSPQLAINKLFDVVSGVVNIALYDIKKCQFILASNNGSLFYYQGAETLFFGSEKQIVKNTLIASKGIHENNFDTTIQQVRKEEILLINLTSNVQIDFVPSIVNIDLNSENKYTNRSLEYSKNINIPTELEKHVEEINKNVSTLKRCTKCILPESFPGIFFDQKGVCSYCNSYTKKKFLGKMALDNFIDKLPREKPVLVAFSGGRDSSYCLHYLKKEFDLNCIAYSYDWGMLTDLGRRNQSLMCSKLNIEHILVSADIRKKRENVRLNVEAWLKKPSLGMIPLFMAGDKQYFYHAYRLLKELDASTLVMGENYLEKTGFKTAFSGAKQTKSGSMAYHISSANKLRMVAYYLGQYITNPAYINKSILDTVGAANSYYGLKHDYVNLFDFIPWNEKEVDEVLINQYGWETEPMIKTTWRIGDGTAAFYNYIYYAVAGFTEADTFRSNQIREGLITREMALSKIHEENQPVWNSIEWYCKTIGINWEDAIKKINTIKTFY